MRQNLTRLLGVVLIVIGLFFLGQHYISGYQIKQNQNDVAIENMTADQLKDNQTKDAVFDHSEIRNVSEKEVRESRERIKNGYADVNVIGALAMPEADVKVSIMKGLSEDVLLSGAGTFYPDQKMGEGNYPLASHNMNVVQKGLLLSPIVDKAQVGQKIYMTDLEKIYVYDTYFVEDVPPTRVDLVDPNLLDPETQQPIITLMTCTDDATERRIVQGRLVETQDFSQASPELLALFEKD